MHNHPTNPRIKKILNIFEEALQKIAACQKHADGDIVDIARKALVAAHKLNRLGD